MSKAFRAIWDGAKWDIGTTPDGTSRIRWWDDVDEVWHDVAHANVDGEWVRIPGAPGPELRSDVGFFDDGDDGDDLGPVEDVWDYWGSDQWVITPRTNEKLLSNAVVGIPGGLVLVSTEWQEGYLSWGFRTPSTYETAWGAEDSTRLPTNTLTLPSEASGLIWAIGTIGSRINVILKTDVSGGGSRHEALGFLINPLTEMYLPYRLVFTGGNSTWGIHQDFDRIIDGDTLHFINDGPTDPEDGYSVYYGSAELPDTLTPIPEDPSITIDGWAQWPATIEQAWYQVYDFNPPPDEEGGTVVGLVDHLDDNWVYARSGHWVKPVRHFVEQFGELE